MSVPGATQEPKAAPARRAIGLFIAVAFSALVWVALISVVAIVIAWVQSPA